MSSSAERAAPGDVADLVALTERARAEMIMFGMFGERSSLNRAIKHFTAAVTGATDHPAASVALANLAGALLTRFEIDGSPADLAGAVRAGQDAVDAMTSGDPARAGALTNLSAALLAEYERGGTATALDRAVTAAQDAADRASPDRGATMSMVAVTLLTRYERDGRPMDLETAVNAASDAVGATAAEDPDRGARLSNQAIVLRARYELQGSTPDLEAAIRIGASAVEATAATRPERAMYLANLAGALCVRIERLGRAPDVERAVLLARRAVDSAAPTSPHRPAQLSILGLVLRLAAENTTDVLRLDAALDAAVDAARAAVDASGSAHPERRDHLVNLAIALRLRGERGHPDRSLDSRDVDARARDFGAAVDVAEAAVATGSGRAADSARLLALAHALAARHRAHGDRRDLWRALANYRRAAFAATSPAMQRLAAAHRWGSLAREQGCLAVALAGFTAAVGLLPLAAWHGLDRRSREHQLAVHASLATEAAEAAIAAGKPDRAVELLEGARTVLWAQQLRLRGDLGELARERPELTAELDRVRALLDRPSGTPGVAALSDLRRQSLAAEWDALLSQVRRDGRFAHFLQPRPLHELRAAAAAGPIVIVTAAQRGCHALIVRAHEPVEALALPGMTWEAAVGAANALRTIDLPDTPPERRRDVVDDVLDLLWRQVVRPVTGALRAAGAVERLRWCPTGPMTLLPLHAARERGAAAPDALSSYTVALEPMLRSRRPRSALPARLLAVGVPHGFGSAPPLPAAEREIAGVAAVHNGPVRALVGPAATRRGVLAALPTHDPVHFACHVVRDADDPAAAGFVLTDEVVTIAHLAELELPHGELAVLPGCGTAVGHGALLDEAMHMAAALQMIGYRHVVATLWSTADAVGPQFARAFHEALDGGRAGGVPAAVHGAAAAVRARHGGRPDGWAPFVHFGP